MVAHRRSWWFSTSALKQWIICLWHCEVPRGPLGCEENSSERGASPRVSTATILFAARKSSDALVFGGRSGYAGVHFACEVGHDSDYSFDQHELAAMVHFVFFHGEDHFEAAFIGRRHSGAHLNALGEKIFGEPVE